MIALMSSGPAARPKSANRRHPPRNCGLASAGAASAPRVITMPEPIPLPRAMTSATAVSAGMEPVRGSAIIPRPRMTTVGTAIQARPNRSMTAPAG